MEEAGRISSHFGRGDEDSSCTTACT